MVPLKGLQKRWAGTENKSEAAWDGEGSFHQSTKGLGGDRLLHLDCGGFVTGRTGSKLTDLCAERVMLPYGNYTLI